MARPLLDALTKLHDDGHEPDLSCAVPAGQHRRVVLDEHQGEVPRTAAQPDHHRLHRVLRDRLRRHQHRRQGRVAHRRPARDDRPPHRRPRRGRQRGQARLGCARADREEGQHPGRLLQGREEDRRDVQDLQRCALCDPRRLRRGRGGRQRHDARPRLACRSTAAARRSTPKRSRPRSRATPTCSTRWWSASPIERFGQYVAAVVQPPRRHRTRRWPSSTRSCASEIAGYKVPRSLWCVDEMKRSPAGKPDYRWAKDTTEERPADDVHAKHAGAPYLDAHRAV